MTDKMKNDNQEERENSENKAPGFKNLEKETNTNDDEIVMGTEADVTKEDLELLGDKDQDMDEGDDEMMARSTLDNTDEDGIPLNEASGKDVKTGEDLDVPGSELDDSNEDIGEEDEENNYYSQSDNNK